MSNPKRAKENGWKESISNIKIEQGVTSKIFLKKSNLGRKIGGCAADDHGIFMNHEGRRRTSNLNGDGDGHWLWPME